MRVQLMERSVMAIGPRPSEGVTCQTGRKAAESQEVGTSRCCVSMKARADAARGKNEGAPSEAAIMELTKWG